MRALPDRCSAKASAERRRARDADVSVQCCAFASSVTAVGAARVSTGPPISVMERGCARIPRVAISATAATTAGAGWHTAKRLVVPSNVTLVWLPSYSPQLNPVERLWLLLRERHLSHRLLDDYDAIVDALCRAWNALTPERIRSLTCYPYLEQVKV